MPFFRSSKHRPSTTHPPADGFSDVAHAAGARAAYVEQWSLRAPWGIRYPGSDHAVVHCMVRGSAMVSGLGEGPITIPEGGMLLLPQDVPHTLASSLPVDDAHLVEHDGILSAGAVHNFAVDGEPDARVLTLPYAVPGRAAKAEVDAVVPDAPKHAVVDRPEADLVEIVLLASKLALMPGVGDRYVACRLAEAVLGKVLVRVAGARDDRFGLFGMFASLGVRSALKAIEGDVAHNWTLGELAELAGLPRTAFKREFQDAMGISLPEYLGLRRLRRCEGMLQEGMTNVAEAAAAAGFRSRASMGAMAKRFGADIVRPWLGDGQDG